MLSFLSRLFDSNEKEIEALTPIITQINALEEDARKLKDSDFPKKTKAFQDRIKAGEPLTQLLPEAFALVREAARRSIGQRHYDVQLMASMVLSQGKIAEQKTGEGKTLSAVPALYLHSLSGNTVHLVTVNDYLARRDAGWMGPIFHLLGVSVSAIINEKSLMFDPTHTNENVHDFRLTHLREVSRKEAYQAQIVYGINSEFGFDYLRDNMAQDKKSMVQNGHHFAIVDEVDSVLIDEARTPHIISAPDEVPTQKYYEYSRFIDSLSSKDYEIDEKLRTAHLTDQGIEKIEKISGITNIYEKDFDTVYHIEAALKAKTLFHKEKDYIVKDNQVVLVDEFTGRLMIGRRLSEGLHQALEAKEGVAIQRESKTLATISLQNYFRLYKTLAGMTGTAITEAEEFHKIYHLDVVVIPTHKPVNRQDYPDAVYKTTQAKLNAIVKTVADAHKKGQPVLVGTTSIDKNEIVSRLLTKQGIAHEVLNAKNHEREAEIIARAGMKGAVTVATNMAGRGVDIILGGDNPKYDDGRDKEGTPEWKAWQKNHEDVLNAGGLLVIGTERHESRRIDNQLRGRSGRQADPGSSRFFVALDDDIMRLFGGATISSLMTRFNMPEDIPLEHSLVSKAIEQAQMKVEGFNFDTRKHLVEYDDVLNKQREIIYARRREILHNSSTDEQDQEKLKKDILSKVQDSIHTLLSMRQASIDPDMTPLSSLIEEFCTIIPFDPASKEQLVKQLEQLSGSEAQEQFLTDLATQIYAKREEQFGPDLMRQIERFVLLSTIDTLWMNHLDAIDNLRQGIGLRGYGQRDPLVEYKNEAFRMFEQLIQAITDEVTHRIYKMQVEVAPPLPKVQNQITNTPESEVSTKQQTKTEQKVGRNDLCPCGSGKKYKKCHGK